MDGANGPGARAHRGAGPGIERAAPLRARLPVPDPADEQVGYLMSWIPIVSLFGSGA